MDESKWIYATKENNVLCSVADPDVGGFAPCSHDEADTQLFLHVSDAVRDMCSDSAHRCGSCSICNVQKN